MSVTVSQPRHATRATAAASHALTIGDANADNNHHHHGRQLAVASPPENSRGSGSGNGSSSSCSSNNSRGSHASGAPSVEGSTSSVDRVREVLRDYQQTANKAMVAHQAAHLQCEKRDHHATVLMKVLPVFATGLLVPFFPDPGPCSEGDSDSHMSYFVIGSMACNFAASTLAIAKGVLKFEENAALHKSALLQYGELSREIGFFLARSHTDGEWDLFATSAEHKMVVIRRAAPTLPEDPPRASPGKPGHHAHRAARVPRVRPRNPQQQQQQPGAEAKARVSRVARTHAHAPDDAEARARTVERTATNEGMLTAQAILFDCAITPREFNEFKDRQPPSTHGPRGGHVARTRRARGQGKPAPVVIAVDNEEDEDEEDTTGGRRLSHTSSATRAMQRLRSFVRPVASSPAGAVPPGSPGDLSTGTFSSHNALGRRVRALGGPTRAPGSAGTISGERRRLDHVLGDGEVDLEVGQTLTPSPEGGEADDEDKRHSNPAAALARGLPLPPRRKGAASVTAGRGVNIATTRFTSTQTPAAAATGCAPRPRPR